jgi:hypothetical protein
MRKKTLLFQVLFVGFSLTMIALTTHALSSGNRVNPDEVATTSLSRMQTNTNRSKPVGQQLIKPSGDGDVGLRAGEVIPSIGINLSGKMDVALAIGKAAFAANVNFSGTINYAGFENELRAWFNGPSNVPPDFTPEDHLTTTTYYNTPNEELLNWAKSTGKYGNNPPMLPNSDLYISAATMSAMAMSDNFPWWEYDHVFPQDSQKYDHVNHKYYEYTSQSEQANYKQSVLPRHIILGDNGATLRFEGYHQHGYVDFAYLPNDEATRKIIEYGIQEDGSAHAFGGNGFFFNCKIDDDKPYGNGQLMNGYLLYFQYNGYTGQRMLLYKFQNVNTKSLHATKQSTNNGGFQSGNPTTNGTFQYMGGTWTCLAQSNVYNKKDVQADHPSRRIKIEIDPQYVRVWFNASKTPNPEIVNTPFADYPTAHATDPGLFELDPDEHLVKVGNVTTGWQLCNGTKEMETVDGGIELDPTFDPGGYGFGPMASYNGHNCDQQTIFIISNLTMSMSSVRKLHEVVADPHWHDNTKRVLVNLNLQNIEDFSTSAQMGDLLARVINDNIYYIGWCSDENKTESQQFANASNPTGTLLNVADAANYDDNDPISPASRTLQMRKIAEAIYDVWYKANVDNMVLVTDNVNFTVAPAESGANTADPDWPDGKWKFIHKTPNELQWQVASAAEDNKTPHPLSDRRMSNLDIDFTYPGEYDVYYRNVMIKTITAHRTPVAQFAVNMANPTSPVFTDQSYDPDDYNPVRDPNNGSYESPGIVRREWKWIDLTADKSGSGKLTSLELDHVYLIELTVTDKWGATATAAKTLKPSSGNDKEPSMAMFELSPVTFIKGLSNQEIVIADHSYDDYGREFNYDWTSQPSDLISKLGIRANGTGQYKVPSTLEVGEYKIILTVTEQETNTPSLPASRIFWVIEDKEPPKARVDKTAADSPYQGYTTVTLTFADTLVYDASSQQNVMSGFKQQWVYVSPTPIIDPANDIPDWGDVSTANNRAVNLPVGESYVYWKAEDNVGNISHGVFGKYTVIPFPTLVTLTTVPASGDAIFGGNVQLTATLPNSKNPYEAGTIEFWMDGDSLGVADIIRGIDNSTAPEIYTAYAVFDVKLKRAGSDITFETKFGGDIIHEAGDKSISSYQVKPNPDATIVGAVDDMIYNGQGIPTPNVTVNYPVGGADPSEYAITYSGNEYGDESMPYLVAPTSPVNVGDYKAKAETTNKNYVVRYDSVDFHITPRMVTVTVTPPATPVQTGDPVSFTATIGNLVDQPAGTVTFYLDGDIVASDVPVNYTSGPTGTADWTWLSAAGGSHDIMAEFVPATLSNYASNIHIITGYDVNKTAQDALYFVYNDDGVTPVPDADASDEYDGQTQLYATVAAAADADTITFGDPDVTLQATGGLGTGNITYELLSQSPNGGTECVTFYPYTHVAKIKGAGEFRVRATRAADPDYNAADTVLLVKIARASGNIEIQVDDINYLEQVRPVITKNLSEGAIDYLYEGILFDGTPFGPVSTPPTDAGEYTLTVTSAQTANYEAATSAPASFKIQKLPQTIFRDHDSIVTKFTTDTIPFTLPVTGGAGTGAWMWSSDDSDVTVDKVSGKITLQPGVIPPADGPRLYTITVQKEDDNNYLLSNILNFVISVDYEPTIIDIDALAPDFATAGYKWTIKATGLPPYIWDVENLPAGMSYHREGEDHEKLVVQGTPLDVFDGDVIIRVTNADGDGKTTEFHVPMKVCEAPAVSTDGKRYVDLNENAIVTYSIPMETTMAGVTVTVNGRPAVGYWQSDQELVIPHPRDGYDYNTEYTVVISGLNDANQAIIAYSHSFTFRTGSPPPPPVISRIVTILPLPEGVTSNPAPEVEHIILSGEDFICMLTVPDPDEWEPVIVTSRIIEGVTERLKGERIDDTNVYGFVVRQIRQEYVEISVTLEACNDVSNEVAGAETKIWSHDGKLYVETSHEGILSAYTLAGELCLQEAVAGNARFTLPRGVYIAKMHGKICKVMIH